jgi:hypothetical protein
MLKYKYLILIIFFVIGIIFYVFAQPGGSSIMNMGLPDGCDLPECRDVCEDNCESLACLECLDSTQIPLDGGLLWLLLAGAGYGVKKIVDLRKKQ